MTVTNTFEIPPTDKKCEEIHFDYRHPQLINDAGNPFELDIYLPTKKLGIEYQGNALLLIPTYFSHQNERRTTL